MGSEEINMCLHHEKKVVRALQRFGQRTANSQFYWAVGVSQMSSPLYGKCSHARQSVGGNASSSLPTHFPPSGDGGYRGWRRWLQSNSPLSIVHRPSLHLHRPPAVAGGYAGGLLLGGVSVVDLEAEGRQ